MAQFSGGSGIEDDPYIITTETQLAQLATYVNAGTAPYANEGVYYKLGNNITLSENWTPIGNAANRIFMGVFDGNDKVISNLNYTDSDLTDYMGLFGIIGNTGIVKNLGVLNVHFSTTGISVGGIAANNRGSVLNCYTTGIISCLTTMLGDPLLISIYIGGIVGDNEGSVSNCFSSCTIKATINNSGHAYSYAGGVVGNNRGSGSSVSACYSTGTINASASSTVTGTIFARAYAGGVAGRNEGIVQCCYSTDSVSSFADNVNFLANVSAHAGGVVGYNIGSILESYSIGTISAYCYAYSRYSYAGGIVGEIAEYSSSVSNCAGLNPKINSDIGTNRYYRRIGYRYSGGPFTNNIAFNNMINPSGGTEWSFIGASNQDGANSTIFEINADGTLGGRFVSDIWTTEDGKLPGLFGNAVIMPEHLLLSNYPMITTENLPNGTIDVGYNQALTATGADPIIWSMESGNLPNGLTLSAGGIISGTPTSVTTSNFTVKATNSFGSDTKALSITINGIPPVITTTTLSNGIVGTSYSQTLAATGTTPMNWSLSSGSLPTGLSLSSAGVISGTPSEVSTYNFTVQATNLAGNNTKALAITINGVPPVITTTTLPGGIVGTLYSQTLTATGTTPVNWSLSNGNLPTGLSLSSAGVISGTPSETGTYNFTVQATNMAGNNTKALAITVSATPVITTTTLPDGIVGTSYNQTLTATGTTPVNWSMSSGNLPTGLSLSAAGVISGTPTAAGVFNFTIKATNSVGNDTKALSILVLEPPTITTTTLPSGLTGTAYSIQLSATGTTPITWTLESGNLPVGLSISTDGLISGIPTAESTFNFTVKATNSVGSDTKPFSIIITAAAVAPTITTTTLPDGKTDTEYSTHLEATGTAPITWLLESGSLPNGLTLLETGIISGIPITAGTFNFKVQATNSAGNDAKTLSILIDDVGVSENEMRSIVLFPNPTTGKLSVISYQLSVESIEVFDVYGRKLSSNHLIPKSSNQIIDISYLSAGIYFMKINTEKGELMRKVVKK